MNDLDLLIVGGGPAGMSAALEAASHGLRCCLIDEEPGLGGQIYRTGPLCGAAHANGKAGASSDAGDVLRARIRDCANPIDVRSTTAVWSISPDNTVAMSKIGEDSSELVRPKLLLLATGAYEYVPPFPGWTLPGVMTPGAAQILVKTMGVLPGQRIMLAGTGPFLLSVACQLVRSGANVVSVLEASPRSAWMRLPLSSFRAWDLLKEGLSYLGVLARARVPVRYGRIVTSAVAGGGGELGSVTHAPVDVDWRADRGREQTQSVDALGVGFGFIPRVYLPQLAGCEMDFEPRLGGWIPRRDRDLFTSVPNLLVAGDGAGVAGALPAALEGRLAGLSAAHRLGAIDDREAASRREPIERERARIETLRVALDRISQIRPGLSELVTDDTIVCRCEEVDWAEARSSIDHGGVDFRNLKIMTRVGMGMCQARLCWPSLSRMLAEYRQVSIGDVGPISPRPPIRPVTVGALAALPERNEQDGATR